MRGLIRGSRRSRRICCELVAAKARSANRTRKRSARAGCLQSALHAAGARRGARCARSLRRDSARLRSAVGDRQPARVFRKRRCHFRRKFSRRAARPCARLCGDRDDRFDEHQRAADRSPGESGFERRFAGVSCAQAGMQSGFMIAQVAAAALVERSESAGASGERRQRADFRRKGRSCFDGDDVPRSSCARSWRTRKMCLRSNCWRPRKQSNIGGR